MHIYVFRERETYDLHMKVGVEREHGHIASSPTRASWVDEGMANASRQLRSSAKMEPNSKSSTAAFASSCCC